MKARAARFATEWAHATSEKSDAQEFWRDFLKIFGVSSRRRGVFEYLARRHSTGKHGWIDLLIPGEAAIEQKSRGGDLDDAMDQLADYLVDLPEHLLPHTLVACDFAHFLVRDSDTGSEERFALAELPAHVGRFAFLAGYDRVGHSGQPERAEVEVNVSATLYLARIHEGLKATNYPAHATGLLLTRLLYLLFADDTGIFDKALFHDWLVTRTAENGSDLGAKLNELFAVLDTPPAQRQSNLDADLRSFTYINGGLFREDLRPAVFDQVAREDLLAACLYDWSKISPAIFGSLFQNVMNENPDLRRRLGAHYTTRAGIAAVIGPLFMDELHERFEVARTAGKRRRLGLLRELRNELSTLTFFDPSCGSGNFLVESYLALRRLETQVLVAIRDEESGSSEPAGLGTVWLQTADAAVVSTVRSSQFYGIEIEEFPARIAEVAMHLADHIANLELSAAFGHTYARLPLEDNLNILVGNALKEDWAQLLPAERCAYLFGNPPFGGQYQKDNAQTEDLKAVWGKGYNGYLDYVTGWYIKAADYIKTGVYDADHPPTKVAFVSTNSICQGEPVAPLWEPLFADGFSIDFAHRTFRWTSDASGRAGVHCVIVGWSQGLNKPKALLYERHGAPIEAEAQVTGVANINAYLADAPNVFVKPRTYALSPDLPDVLYGSKVADGGHLLVTAEQHDAVAADPVAARYLRRFIGARELMHDLPKWCLWLNDVTAADRAASPVLRERIAAVAAYRSEPGRDREVYEAALRPATFLRDKQPRVPYVGIPAHVSQHYTYYALSHFQPAVITGNHNFTASDPDGYVFALMSSAMFMTWMRGVAGRIRNDLRFSKTLVWHNFPVPAISALERAELCGLGKKVLAARNERPGTSLAQMYEPGGFWRSLAESHRDLDRAVDKIFGARSLVRSDEARLSLLFERYMALASR